eukprot:6178138-Pleurochrysis_carterae.AAC.3
MRLPHIFCTNRVLRKHDPSSIGPYSLVVPALCLRPDAPPAARHRLLVEHAVQQPQPVALLEVMVALLLAHA